MADEDAARNEARMRGEGLRLRSALEYLVPSEYRAYADAENALKQQLPIVGDWFSGQVSLAELSTDRRHRNRVWDKRERVRAAAESELVEQFGRVVDERALRALGRLRPSGEECPLPDGFWHRDTKLDLSTASAEADGQTFDGVRVLCREATRSGAVHHSRQSGVPIPRAQQKRLIDTIAREMANAVMPELKLGWRQDMAEFVQAAIRLRYGYDAKIATIQTYSRKALDEYEASAKRGDKPKS